MASALQERPGGRIGGHRLALSVGGMGVGGVRRVDDQTDGGRDKFRVRGRRARSQTWPLTLFVSHAALTVLKSAHDNTPWQERKRKGSETRQTRLFASGSVHTAVCSQASAMSFPIPLSGLHHSRRLQSIHVLASHTRWSVALRLFNALSTKLSICPRSGLCCSIIAVVAEKATSKLAAAS